ncbi:DUF4369 domain-containing protein [Chitinophaga horti]|uniref:DUF4369 domain-containing protein n=1 Tax=Chitinophaga horti TaxID=2920382 RepID=A0ABY6IY81_9BACT|nr:DUF4369 domain-containing protein [Chitinophaga horti]UYQ90969.1 DUF4369 domain-containing protein [Chitinophaga horti]
MKNLHFLVLAPALLATLASSAQKVAADATVGEVVVRGKIGDLQPPKQLWIYMGDEKWDTVAVRNGVFEYRKTTKLPAYGAIMVKHKPYYETVKASGPFFGNMSLMSVFFEKGTMIVNSATDTIKSTTPVKGSVLQSRYAAYWKKKAISLKHKSNWLPPSATLPRNKCSPKPISRRMKSRTRYTCYSWTALSKRKSNVILTRCIPLYASALMNVRANLIRQQR